MDWFLTRMCSLPLAQFFQNHGPKLRDAASAQGQDHVSILGDRDGCGDGLGGRTYIPADLRRFYPNPLRQDFAGDAFDGLFAGGVNIEDEERVGIIERGGEFFDEIAGACVAMRLEDDMDLLEAALPRRRQRRLDLGGMMAVVVDHAHAGNASAQLEPAVDAAELVERRAD